MAPQARGDNVLAEMSPGDMALRVYDWTRRIAETWRGSKMEVRREILETVSLNRTLSDVSLCTQKRKPFDILAERPKSRNGTPKGIRTPVSGMRVRCPGPG